ncbi:MAG TPA: ATP-binding protein [Acidimicrobiales bacterium]|nr:ATP-binding protein [Acidimicrobiales bacterium]
MARRLISLFTVLAVLVVVAASVGAWWVIRQGVDRQNRALLHDDVSQLASSLQSELQLLRNNLDGVVFYALGAPAGAEAQVFAEQAKPVLTSPATSVALVSISPPKVLFAEGPDLRAGEYLPSSVVTQAPIGLPSPTTPTLGATVFHSGSKTLLAITSTLVIDPNYAAIETVKLNQTTVTPNRTGPYSRLFVNLYNATKPVKGQLIATTYGLSPLPQPVASEIVRYEGVAWLVEASPRAPLVGDSAAAASWIVLGIGLILAMVLGASTEMLVRRQRHTASVVAQREAELLEAQDALVLQERLSAVGEMTTVIGHELRNPLGAVINSLYLIRNRLAGTLDPEVEGFFDRVERETTRAAKLSEDLTAFMRDRVPEIEELDLREMASEVLQSTPQPSGVAVNLPTPGVVVDADKAQLVQMLANLVTNAYHAMPDGGTLQISGSMLDGSTKIAVQDSGKGIDPAHTHRLFEPFFTTKPTGTGLGLAIVKRLVEGHGGDISLANRPEGGTQITISLPRVPHGGRPLLSTSAHRE